SIDISNKMDREWKINIMKSSAGVPYAIRPWLTAIAKEIRNDARDVYGHRAGRKKRKRRVNNQSPWKRIESSSGSFIYGLDKNHPIFKALIKSSR
ncbi:MAG: hypothetical protein QGG87_02340, partial [Nitrospinota bacterium]|nr:hypothetical protein [Nitrospinota bacterium]